MDPTKILAGVTLLTTLRYFLFAGLAWLLGYVWFQRRWFHRKIVQALPSRSDVRREIFWSVVTLLIFGLVGTLTVLAINQGWTQLYRHFSDHSWGWWWASIGLTILLHDTWFYWTHRLMHHRKLFKFFHRTHHLSMNPSPWASFAFSPAEAVLQSAIFPLAIFLIPQHPTAFGVFMVWQMTFNVIGHTGYEYNRPGLMRSWVRYIVNTPTNHAMHHEKIRGNYGLYFNFWDRLMRTNHKDYERRFLEVTTRPRPVNQLSEVPAQSVEAAQQNESPQFS